ncbi:MAG: glycosyltransferase family 4 protein [Armatimonadota bacterium]|nr:glycosyltransferase family 4 protein [bacterium]
MKIYCVVQSSPWPATSGGAIRCFRLIQKLKRDHEVIVVLANPFDEERQRFMNGDGFGCQRRVLDSSHANRLADRIASMSIAKYRMDLLPGYRDLFRESLQRLVNEERPDLLWYYQSPSIWFTGVPTGVPTIFDMCDRESWKYALHARQQPLFRRLLIKADVPFFNAAELKRARQCDVVLMSNPDEAADLKAPGHVILLPNGFDFSNKPKIAPRDGKRLLFCGLLLYQPNIDGMLWFCKMVWPRVLKTIPDAVLDIVGRYDSRLDSLKSQRGVCVHGFVDNIEPFLTKSSCLVVPLQVGSGTRLKILEAWSNGLPIVTTSVGCAGLGAHDGETLLIANRPDDLAKKCVKLLQNPELGATLAERGFNYGKDSFDWETLYPKVDQAIAAALGNSQTAKVAT